MGQVRFGLGKAVPGGWVYRLGEGVWERVAVPRDDASARVAPFEAIELQLRLGLLWER